jgi:DNA-binding transcriptional LysR family regulator
MMRDVAGAEKVAPLKETVVFDDPEAMCRAALLGLGVTLIAVPHALPYLESGALVRLVPQWYSDAGPISIYYATRTLLPAKTRVFVDFVVDAFRSQRLAERFAGIPIKPRHLHNSLGEELKASITSPLSGG